jgi:hypothetical protein
MSKKPDSALRPLREKLGLSQEAVARLFNVTLQTVWRWDVGRTPVPDQVLHLLPTLHAGKVPGWCKESEKNGPDVAFLQSHLKGCEVCRVAVYYLESTVSREKGAR